MTQIKRTNGFTLAEVLIVIGIIGIVAAMTLSNLKTVNESHLKKGWKLAYANILNAYNITKSKGISVCGPNPNASYYCAFNTEFADEFLTNFKYSEIKPLNRLYYKDFGGKAVEVHEMSGGKKVYLLDGSIMYIGQAWPAWNILVDVNGEKKPNVVGQDLFGTEVREEWLKAIGTKNSTGWNISSYGASTCASNSTYTMGRFVYLSGAGCSYKYLYE